MTQETKTLLLLLVDLYEYATAYELAKTIQQFPQDLLDFLYMLKERRELNIQPAIEQGYIQNKDPQAEQIANYLLDLEVKLKKSQLIDFVRAVSPIIYRLFWRLLLMKIPDLKDYVHDSKDHRYDTWKRHVLAKSPHATLQQYKPERIVTSNSLAVLIQQLDFPPYIKETVLQLRSLERSVRNPLAHLIKPFDEEELHRTTNFSSQTFLNLLVELARKTGVQYDKIFYLDTCNAQLREKLENS